MTLLYTGWMPDALSPAVGSNFLFGKAGPSACGQTETATVEYRLLVNFPAITSQVKCSATIDACCPVQTHRQSCAS